MPCARPDRPFRWFEGLLPGEQVELARVLVRLGADGFVVAAYLSVVVCLEVEGELHQCLGDVGGGFIGDGELMLLLCAGIRVEPSGLTVDLGFGAEALALDDDGIDVVQDAVEDGGGQVLSLLKICGQYL